MTNPTAAALIIGNEILSGRTQDANLREIALRLLPLGVRLAEARVVPDIESVIIGAVNDLRRLYDYVFTTGGIGTTHDDITAASIAKAFGRKVVEHPEARAKLLRYYGAENLTPTRLRMALVPEGASLIDNPVSSAPGFRLENVFVLAGIPEVMRGMLEEIAAGIKGGAAYRSRGVSGKVTESVIAVDLEEIAARYTDCDIGSYPWFRMGQYGLVLVVRGTDEAQLDAATQEVLALMRRHDSASALEGE